MSTFKVNEKHWEVIVNFMEKRKDFAAGRLNNATSRIHHKRLWEQLASQLNSLGYGQRSVEKWQKTWTDFKYSLKKKASKKEVFHMTGEGALVPEPPLNSTKERILNLLGNTIHEGLNVVKVEDQISNQKNNYKLNALSSSKSSLKSRINKINERAPSVRRLDDYNYIHRPKTRKRKFSADEVREKSLEQLEGINRALTDNLPKLIEELKNLREILQDWKESKDKIY